MKREKTLVETASSLAFEWSVLRPNGPSALPYYLTQQKFPKVKLTLSVF